MDSVLVFHVLVISSNAQAEHTTKLYSERLKIEFEPRTATSAATTKATKETIITTITET